MLGCEKHAAQPAQNALKMSGFFTVSSIHKITLKNPCRICAALN